MSHSSYEWETRANGNGGYVSLNEITLHHRSDKGDISPYTFEHRIDVSTAHSDYI